MSKNNHEAWPKIIPVLQPSDFSHGDWGRDGDTEGAWCGKTRCMVGWVGHVFHNDTRIATRGKRVHLGAPARKFMRKLLELSGANFPAPDNGDMAPDLDYDLDLMGTLSDRFEGDQLFYELSTEEAAALWNKAVKACGYTEIVDVK